MEAQQNQALQQTQSQSANNSGNILPWGTPVPSSSTVNNTALPNPWGSISTPPAQPFGTFSLNSAYYIILLSFSVSINLTYFVYISVYLPV